jgi:hypothetical protein
MRDRRNISDRRNRKSDGLQRAKSRFPSGTRPFHLHLQRLYTVILRFPAGVFSGHLRRIGRRFSGAFETLRTSRRPRN